MEADRGLSLREAGARIGVEPVQHKLFLETMRRVREAVRAHSMVLLVGAPGVGKTMLARALAEGSEWAGVMVTAPAPHRRAFSWIDMWYELLEALDDPLPQCKVDHGAVARSLSHGRWVNARPASEGALRRAVYAALRDRGIGLLVIDEAMSLVSSEHGRVLRHQLDVLRGLADRPGLRIVLVSTPRILPSLELSGELARRMDEVHFPRYAHDRKSFSRVIATFLHMVRPDERFRPDPAQRRFLHAASLGCVGHLADWLRRAYGRCLEEEASALAWEHLTQTMLREWKLNTLRDEIERGEERLREREARAFALNDAALEACGPSAASEPSGPSEPPGPPGPKKRRARARRVGTPSPRRARVQ